MDGDINEFVFLKNIHENSLNLLKKNLDIKIIKFITPRLQRFDLKKKIYKKNYKIIIKSY